MNRGTTAAIIALAAGAALARAAEEPKTYDVRMQDRWTAGQVVTVTEHEAGSTDTSMAGTVILSVPESFDATYVLRCDEVDAKGKPTKRTLFVKAWKKAKGKKSDESLAGLRISVSGGEWTLPEGRSAGPLAKAWLDSKFAGRSDNPFSKLAPTRMAVGQTWKPDLKEAVDFLGKSLEGAPFDLAKIEMEVTLVSVEGAPPDELGKFVVKVLLPIPETLPGLPAGTKLLPGSTAGMTAEHNGPLTTSTMLGTDHFEMNMKMDFEATIKDQPVSLTSTGTMVRERKTVAGGEIPKDPAKPASGTDEGK